METHVKAVADAMGEGPGGWVVGTGGRGAPGYATADVTDVPYFCGPFKLLGL